MKIQLTKTIDNQVIEDIFVTALEGGSNYWYYLPKESVKTIRNAVSESEDPYLSTAMFKAVMRGAIVIIHDAENEDDAVGMIDIRLIPYRLQKLFDSEHAWALDQEIAGKGDAGSSDVVFQYLAMGEVVYG